ncbi:DUF6234 family protein [Streptomyces syringium]|uniref:DUF6234 family protein n=1 Tax=Streptomyces syringium TaxID=76729 RepID=UPI003414CD35
MTYAFPEPPAWRRRPWSRRTPLGPDIGIGILLFLVEVTLFLWVGFGYGMEVRAAQGQQEQVEAAQLAQLTWMQRFFVATIVFAGLAALFRAPWTVLSQLLAAGTVAALLVLAQHDYDRTHPDSASTSGADYAPCFSGSGKCS